MDFHSVTKVMETLGQVDFINVCTISLRKLFVVDDYTHTMCLRLHHIRFQVNLLLTNFDLHCTKTKLYGGAVFS